MFPIISIIMHALIKTMVLFITTIIGIISIVPNLVHANAVTSVKTQFIGTGAIIGAGWFQDVNNRLPPAGGTVGQQLAKDMNGKLVWRTPDPCSTSPVTPVSTVVIPTIHARDTMPINWFQEVNDRVPPPGGWTPWYILTIDATGKAVWKAPAVCPPVTCWSANNGSFSATPTTNLCSNGSTPTVSLTPWNQYVWSCSGTATCSAVYTPVAVNWVCGTNFTCTLGTLTQVNSGQMCSFDSWKCQWTNGGWTANCTGNYNPGTHYCQYYLRNKLNGLPNPWWDACFWWMPPAIGVGFNCLGNSCYADWEFILISCTEYTP